MQLLDQVTKALDNDNHLGTSPSGPKLSGQQAEVRLLHGHRPTCWLRARGGGGVGVGVVVITLWLPGVPKSRFPKSTWGTHCAQAASRCAVQAAQMAGPGRGGGGGGRQHSAAAAARSQEAGRPLGAAAAWCCLAKTNLLLQRFRAGLCAQSDDLRHFVGAT